MAFEFDLNIMQNGETKTEKVKVIVKKGENTYGTIKKEKRNFYKI